MTSIYRGDGQEGRGRASCKGCAGKAPPQAPGNRPFLLPLLPFCVGPELQSAQDQVESGEGRVALSTLVLEQAEEAVRSRLLTPRVWSRPAP